jgi:hypothetical protein
MNYLKIIDESKEMQLIESLLLPRLNSKIDQLIEEKKRNSYMSKGKVLINSLSFYIFKFILICVFIFLWKRRKQIFKYNSIN